MSATSFLQVLAVLHDDQREATAVLDRAVELADVEHACLTLAKTSDPGRLVRWCGPLAALCRPPAMIDFDLQGIATQQLGRLVDQVPASVPFRTLVLGPDTACAVRQLLAHGSYDLLVIGAKSLSRDFRLRRQLRRPGICVLAVSANRLDSEPRLESPRPRERVTPSVIQIKTS